MSEQVARISTFDSTVPRCCLWCAYGYPVVFGTEDFFEAFACARSTVDNLKSKRVTARIRGPQDSAPKAPRVMAAITGPDDTCEGFRSVLDLGSGFRNARKLRLLDMFGYLGEREK